MKLIGSYTSPFVRKISVILLEKRIPFEFVNESPYSESNGVARYNPLGKVPALVTDDGECWFDSPGHRPVSGAAGRGAADDPLRPQSRSQDAPA